MAGPWKTFIKAHLADLRARKRLRENYFIPGGPGQPQQVFCKCGIMIFNRYALPNYRTAEVLTDDAGAHETPCCPDCLVKILADPSFAFDYYILDLLQWQNEADQVDPATQPQLAQRLSDFIQAAVQRNIV